MKIPRFLLVTGLVTSFSLLYVWQQTEVFRLAYVGQKHLAKAQDLLDKNIMLRYNITQGLSLTQIGAKISNDNNFQMPASIRLVKSGYTPGVLAANKEAAQRQNFVSRIFGIKRQAEAKIITPDLIPSHR